MAKMKLMASLCYTNNLCHKFRISLFTSYIYVINYQQELNGFQGAKYLCGEVEEDRESFLM